MFRKPGSDKIGLLGAFLAIFLGFALHPDTWRDPAPERPVPDRPLPREASVEPRTVRRPPPGQHEQRALGEVNIRSTPRLASGTGTAFVARPGAWVTARHVVDECGRLAFLTGGRSGFWLDGSVEIDGHADLALITVPRNSRSFGAEPIAVNVAQPLPGESGFHYGFPGDGRGRVESTLIGGSWMATRGHRNTDEPVLVWAEVRREGIPSGSLGGMSGGPTLNAQGELVGVTVAEAPRRGRVITAAPRTVSSILKTVPVTASLPAPRFEHRPPSFAELERRGVVRRIYCKFEPPAS